MTTADLITREINHLSDDQQRQVLEFAQTLPRRPAGYTLQQIRQIGLIFSAEDLEEIRKAVEEDCERVDAQSW